MLYLGKRNTSFMASTTSYIINFNKKTGVFTLTSTKDELKVDAKHKKYEWLKSQEAGRIVKISDKGRWNSSKDYIGLYDEINSSKSKKKSTVKSSVKATKRKAKPVKDNSTELKELKTQLKELQTSNNKLKTENTKLKNKIQLLEKKPLPAKQKPKPKPVKKEPKQYKTRITATLKYSDRMYRRNESKDLDITIITEPQFKKPTQSFFKSYLKFAAADGNNYNGKWPHYGLPIYSVSGLEGRTGLNDFMVTEQKITNISFISIKEY
jgi:regulator of replication initiation timing